MPAPAPPPPSPVPSSSNGPLLLVGALGLGLAGGAFALGRMQGAAGERATQAEFMEAVSTRESDELKEARERVALLEQLSGKQSTLLEQLQKLVEVTNQSAEARVILAEGLRESVELASTLLLMEARQGLAPLGRLEVVERAARAALEPYDGRDNEALSPGSLEVKTAAMTLLGDVLREQGRLAEAHDARRQALVLARQRVKAKPDAAARRFALAQAHASLADSLEAGADAAGALAERQEELKILRAMGDAQPGELLYLGELADALGRTSATLASLGKAGEARAYAEEAVGIARGLRGKEPGESRWARVLARALGVHAAQLAAAGGDGAALAVYDEAVLLLEPAGGAQDTDADRAGERADLLLARGEVDLRGGRAAAAVGPLREALDAAVDVVAREPLARAGQERLARVCSSLASALEGGGEPEDALRGRAEAVAAWRRVSELDPTRELPKHELLHALLAWGDSFTAQQRYDEALAAFHEALGLVTALESAAAAEAGEGAAAPVGAGGVKPATAASPAHAATGSDLAECHDRVAATLLLLGRRPEALAAWRKALEVIEPLAKKTPENAFWQADLARIWMHLGEALSTAEPDRAEGERALKRALRLLTALEESGKLPAYAKAWLQALRAAPLVR